MSAVWRGIIALLIIGGLVAAGISWFDSQVAAGVVRGTMTERGVWQAKEIARQTTEKQAVYDQAASAFAVASTNANINFTLETQHADAIKALNARVAALDAKSRAAGGMRITRAVCTPADSPATASSASAASDGGYDDYIARTVALPDDTQRDIRAVGIEADTIVEAFRIAQAWIRAHGFYGPVLAPIVPPPP